MVILIAARWGLFPLLNGALALFCSAMDVSYRFTVFPLLQFLYLGMDFNLLAVPFYLYKNFHSLTYIHSICNEMSLIRENTKNAEEEEFN